MDRDRWFQTQPCSSRSTDVQVIKGVFAVYLFENIHNNITILELSPTMFSRAQVNNHRSFLSKKTVLFLPEIFLYTSVALKVLQKILNLQQK